jgi:hypothetical protein
MGREEEREGESDEDREKRKNRGRQTPSAPQDYTEVGDSAED